MKEAETGVGWPSSACSAILWPPPETGSSEEQSVFQRTSGEWPYCHWDLRPLASRSVEEATGSVVTSYSSHRTLISAQESNPPGTRQAEALLVTGSSPDKLLPAASHESGECVGV